MKSVVMVMAGMLVVGAMRGAEVPLEWRAGVASVVVTPKTNLWMAGYAARTRPAEGTLQDLHAKALALADTHGGKFVFVTIDVIGVPRTLRKKVETRLAEAHQLKPHEFVLNASHTHSGPEYRPGRVADDARGSEQSALAYEVFLANAIHDVVGQALNRMEPARLSYSRARAGFAMNRRQPRPNAEPVNAPHPDGPVDHDVPVLRVDGPNAALRALLFGYACHNTTLTQASYKFCGDYAGYAQEYLQADHPGAIALFMTGSGADQNPYPRGTVDLAQAHGRTLATAVEAALFAKGRVLKGSLRSAYREIDLPFAATPTRADLEPRLKAKDKQEAAHARRMLDRLEKDGSLPRTYTYPLQVVQLGDDLTLVALGAETVVDYSLRLKRELGGPGAVWVSGYSNDMVGYIPSDRVLRERGYEGYYASLYGIMPSPWAAGIEDQIVAAVKALLKEKG